MFALYLQECLKMVSIKKINGGEEIFNTYGQLANWQLLHMYGFTQPYPSNTHEALDIEMHLVYDAAMQGWSWSKVSSPVCSRDPM